MKWDSGYSSSDVEDRRGMGPAGGGGGGGLLFLLFWLFRMFGVPGVIIGLLIFGGMYYCGDGGRGLSRDESAVEQAEGDELASFVGFVLDDAQSTWTKQFADKGRRYDKAKLVLFTGRVDSACGLASAAVGPFYCPRDRKVYIDLSFYRQLRQRLGAPGDFAQAYVIAHEVGHHVQNLLGDLDRSGRAGASGGSVRTELQADCYAGVWAHDTGRRELLEAGDIEEAMRAAEAIGDDALQRAGQGTVQPETWTHGSSAQRMRWFQRGYETGRMDACDTFGAKAL